MTGAGSPVGLYSVKMNEVNFALLHVFGFQGERERALWTPLDNFRRLRHVRLPAIVQPFVPPPTSCLACCMSTADIELSITAGRDGLLTAGLRLELPTRRVDLATGIPITLNLVALRALELMPDAYGAALSAMLFTTDLREAWRQARGFAEGAGSALRVRLCLEGNDDLHAMRWELLRDPRDDLLLAHSERIRFSRFLSSPSLAAIQLNTRPSMHVVVAVANPLVLPTFHLQPVDVADAVARVRASLGDVRTTIVDGQERRPTATLPTIIAALREGAQILYLVCHGALIDGQPYLWLEQEPGSMSRPVPGDALVHAIAQLERPPLLVILASCSGAGDNGAVLGAIGPKLAQTGIGAVLAMRGAVPVALVDALTPRLFAELWRDGQIDRAVAAARAALPLSLPWWLPTLWMAVRDGALWREPVGVSPTTSPEQHRALRNRERMLQKVHHFWVKGVLEPSLYHEALICLGLTHLPTAVANPWDMLIQTPDASPQPLAPSTTIGEVFDAFGGELLILGAPGSGKTTVALELTRILLERAGRDVNLPMPVVFNLASWAERRQPLARWLVDELNARYDVPRALGQNWLATDQVQPILDGLDEVPTEHREACLETINLFRREHGMAGVVVCSRIADYEALHTKLLARGAVLIQPLTGAQIDHYLALAGPPLASLRALIQHDAPFRELAVSPLMLSTMLLASQSQHADWLVPNLPAAEQRRRLFDAYVHQMLTRRGVSRYHPAQLRRWLARLAREMSRQSQTLLVIDRLQPAWLSSGRLQLAYTVVDRLGSALSAGGLSATLAWLLGFPSRAMILFGLICAIATGLFGGSSSTYRVQPKLEGLAVRIAVGFATGAVLIGSSFLLIGAGVLAVPAGFIGGVPSAIAAGLFGMPSLKPRQIAVVESLRWSWAHAWRFGLGSLSFGVLIGGIASLILWLFGLLGLATGLTIAIATAIASGVGAGLFGVVVGGLIGDQLGQQMRPNQGIYRSARSALVIWGLTAVVSAPIAALLPVLVREVIMPNQAAIPTDFFFWLNDPLEYTVNAAFMLGLITALGFGGFAVLSHIALRLVLWMSGTLPLRLAPLLDAAAERVLLRKVGGSYIFVHRLLLEHFAAMSDEERPPARMIPAQPSGAQAVDESHS